LWPCRLVDGGGFGYWVICFGRRFNGSIYWAVKGLVFGKGLDLRVLCMGGRLSVPHGVYYNIEGFN